MKIDLKRSVEWTGKVDVENFKRVTGEIGKLVKKDAKKEIFLFVNSNGGSTGMGFGFYDFLKILNPNLVTIGIGDVTSMGIIIYLCGKKRLLTKHTCMFFHEIGRTFEKDTRFDVTELRGANECIHVREDYYSGIVAEASKGKLDAKQVVQLMRDEKGLRPEAILKMGLADEII